MATVDVAGETYTVSADEKAEFDTLTAAHVDPVTALRIATGNFQDVDPPITPEETQP